MSWTQALKTGVDEGFNPEITIHHEYLDTKRYPELFHKKEFLEHIKAKYKDTKLSVLMVSDDPGLDLVIENRETYFPDLPVVFMGVNNVEEKLLNIPWLTGVFEKHDNVETILEAVDHNSSDSVIIVSDSTSTGQRTLQSIQAGLEKTKAPPEIIIVEDLVTSEIFEKLAHYPDNWPIFLAGQLRDSQTDGALVSFEKEAKVLQSIVPNPSYTNSIMRLGYGTAGGKLLDGNYHAQQAVELVQKILDGTPVNEIEPILQARNKWMFDAQELERSNISLSAIPQESLVINIKPSFYSQYRTLVWVLITLFSFGIITITILAYAISRQKRAERLLKENEKQLETRVKERTAELSETLERLKQTQAQLIQKEKMSSLGQLVGGVAHELNNPLHFFSGNIGCIENYVQDLVNLVRLFQETTSAPAPLVLEKVKDIDFDYLEEDIPNIFRSIHSGAQRIQNLISSLQIFSRADEVGVKLTDINQSIESTLNILNYEILNNIEVHKEYDILPKIICNPGEINQVFLNVITNSIYAIKSCENCPKKIFIMTLVCSEKLVLISIRDTGSGIPEHIQSQVFDPFFTTKPIGKGTGLGLSLAYQIVKNHQGNISICSDPQSGTEVVIVLPMTCSPP